MEASFLGDRARHAPFGLNGGEDAAMFELQMEVGGEVIGRPGMSKLRAEKLRPGDSVEWRSPGGAGFGAPADRPEAQVEADELDGIYTKAETQ